MAFRLHKKDDYERGPQPPLGPPSFVTSHKSEAS